MKVVQGGDDVMFSRTFVGGHLEIRGLASYFCTANTTTSIAILTVTLPIVSY